MAGFEEYQMEIDLVMETHMDGLKNLSQVGLGARPTRNHDYFKLELSWAGQPAITLSISGLSPY